MYRLLILALLIGLLQTSTSCKTTKNIFGTYRSKFAVIGFFGTRITLNNDSTFTYRMRGDLSYDTASGSYTTQGRLLILTAKQPPVDSANIITYELTASSSINRKPVKYLIGSNKIFETDLKGEKVNKEIGYFRHKKYILFGKKMYSKRYYLKRID